MAGGVVQTLMVEMDARTAKLDAALAQSATKVRQFGQSAGAAGDVAGTMGQRYGQASVQVASAAENMARAGKATGEASKMMIKSGAEIAFAFGTQGAIFGAIAILGLAITEMWHKAARDAKEAADASLSEFQRLAHGKDLKATADRLTTVYNGDPVATAEQKREDPRLLGLAELKRRRDAYNKFLSGGSGDNVEVFTNAQGKALKELEETYSRLLPLAQQLAKAEGQRGADAMKVENDLKSATEATAKAEAAAAEARQVALSGAAAQIENLTKQWEGNTAETADQIKGRADILVEAAQLLAKTTKTKLDDIAQMFDPAIKKALAAGNGDLAYTLTLAKEEALALQQSIEDTDDAARSVALDFKDVADATKGSGDNVNQTLADVVALATAIEGAARGGIQLAESFGLLGTNAARSLQAIAQIAGNIPKLSASITAGKMGGAGGIIASALPVVGGIASLVTGLMDSAKAAREHAKALDEARRKLSESLQDRTGGYGLNDYQSKKRELDQTKKSDLTQMLDILIQTKGVHVGTRDDFFKADEKGQRAILQKGLTDASKFQDPTVMGALRDAIALFDQIAAAAAKAAEELEKENEASRKSFDQSLEERRARLKGDNDGADAMALLTQHEQELAAARKAGIYTAEQLAALEQIQIDERKKAADEAIKRREEEKKAADDEAAAKAKTAKRRTEDVQSRINAADGETPAERDLRVALEHRRELEDAMAEGVDAATLALIQFAQATEDAAAAAAREVEAKRGLEDLDVRLLRAQGKSTEADDMEFLHRQEREYQDAVAAGKDDAYLKKLKETQGAEKAARVAGVSIGTTEASIMAGSGQDTTLSHVASAMTAESANRVVSELSSIRIHTKETADELAMIRSLGGFGSALMPPDVAGVTRGGVAIRNTVTVNLNGPVTGMNDGGVAVTQMIVKEVNKALGKLLRDTQTLAGNSVTQ